MHPHHIHSLLSSPFVPTHPATLQAIEQWAALGDRDYIELKDCADHYSGGYAIYITDNNDTARTQMDAAAKAAYRKMIEDANQTRTRPKNVPALTRREPKPGEILINYAKLFNELGEANEAHLRPWIQVSAS